MNDKYVPLKDNSDFSSQITKFIRSQGYDVSYQQIYTWLSRKGYINKLGDPTKRAYQKGLIISKL